MKQDKQEADRLACTGAYKQAAKLYAKLGYTEQAEYYKQRATIKKG